jgi:hypothetical protein
VFGTTLTTLSLSLMEWRGVTVTNVYVANFFFAAALGLLITAQWEMSLGNGFAYTVFSAFGKSFPMFRWPKARTADIAHRTLLRRLRRHSYALLWDSRSLWRRHRPIEQCARFLHDMYRVLVSPVITTHTDML